MPNIKEPDPRVHPVPEPDDPIKLNYPELTRKFSVNEYYKTNDYTIHTFTANIDNAEMSRVVKKIYEEGMISGGRDWWEPDWWESGWAGVRLASPNEKGTSGYPPKGTQANGPVQEPHASSSSDSYGRNAVKKNEDAYEADASYPLDYAYMVGGLAADYVYTSGVFLKVGDDYVITDKTVWKEDDDFIHVGRYMSGSAYYFLTTKAPVDFGDMKEYPGGRLTWHFVKTANPYGEDTMPDMLIKKYGHPVVKAEAKMASSEGVPSYYYQRPVRTTGIERYDPEWAVDPLLVNPAPDRNAQKHGAIRALLKYDDEGNPVGYIPPPGAVPLREDQDYPDDQDDEYDEYEEDEYEAEEEEDGVNVHF